MSAQVLALIVLNFIYIGALPVIFFKKGGRLNLIWWITALPFFLCPLAAALSFVGYLPPLTSSLPSSRLWMELAAVTCCSVSIALISLTIGTHRIPIALWHQTTDAPAHIVTWGAYSRIRHPFYSAFLLAFLATALYTPQVLTLALLASGAAVLNFTAAKEEHKLASCEFGEEYRRYMKRTGRFFPHLGRTEK